MKLNVHYDSLVNNNFHDFLWLLFETLRRIASVTIRSPICKSSFLGIPSPIFFQQVKGLVLAAKFDAISCRRGFLSIFFQCRLGQSTQLQVLVRQKLFTRSASPTTATNCDIVGKEILQIKALQNKETGV